MAVYTDEGILIGCHSCTSGNFVGQMSFTDDFEKEKYDEVIRCDNCGAEVRQLKDEAGLEVYDSEGNLVNRGLGKLPKRS